MSKVDQKIKCNRKFREDDYQPNKLRDRHNRRERRDIKRNWFGEPEVNSAVNSRKDY